MSSNDIHGIEHGWKVKTSDGNEIGSVEETADTYILVKSGLINSTQRYFPAVSLAHVRPDMKEIGISLTQEAVNQGDWSEPPLEGPRTEGAPLNDEDYEEVDPVAAGTTRDPERPTSI